MTGRAPTIIVCSLLALLIGCHSQVVQQQYFPWGRYFGRVWTIVAKTHSLDGQPTGLMVTRNREGFLAYDQNQQTIGDTNQIPVLVAVVDSPPSNPADEDAAPQSRMMYTTDGRGDGLPAAIQSQTGTDKYDPVMVDAEEVNHNKRKKRDFSSWEIFNKLSPGKFFADRQVRDTKATRKLGNSRVKRSKPEGPSEGIFSKRTVPIVEDVDGTRYRRGTDDNVSRWQFHFRSPREAEPKKPKITSWSTSGAGFDVRRKRRDTHMSFEFPILTDWFKN